MIAINISAAGCNVSNEIEILKKALTEKGYDVTIINEDKKAPKEQIKEINIIANYEPWMA